MGNRNERHGQCPVQDFHAAQIGWRITRQPWDWAISTDQGPKALLEAVADGELDYPIGDSVTIGLLQRIHPQLAVAWEQPECAGPVFLVDVI